MRTNQFIGRSFHGQRSVENGKADHLGPGDVWAMLRAGRSKKERACSVSDTAFLPLTGDDPSPFVGDRVSVRGNGLAGLKLPKNHYATGCVIAMQDLQLHTGIGTRLPRFFFSKGEVRKHRLRSSGSSIRARLGGLVSRPGVENRAVEPGLGVQPVTLRRCVGK